MSFLKLFLNSYSRDGLGKKSREKRHRFFMDLIGMLPKPIKILDIGGSQAYWQSMNFPDTVDVHVTLLNLTAESVVYANMNSVVGDATDMGEFKDRSFDVVFSNSVIEHVGKFSAQRRMAEEVSRVGKRYFVQTPNYWFPLEPHFLIPGFQWLPTSLRVWLVMHFNLGWYQKIIDREQARDLVNHNQLLTKKEFQSLFPKAKLYEEKIFGLTKSFILYDGWNKTTPAVRKKILGTQVDHTNYEAATALVLGWAHKRESRYVCAANVHMVMEAYDSPSFQMRVNAADLVTPDGMPLVWALRRMGFPAQGRVYGPDLMISVIEQAALEGVPVGFMGGRPEVLDELVTRLHAQFPALDVRYRFSPPFRPILPEEDAQIVTEINRSGARILFVGLGCPRQESWMAEHAGKIKSVMLGVGAAFDFHAGFVRQAPPWMQNAGLEWLFRFAQEPRRLARRYLYHNPRFMFLLARQLFWQERRDA